MRHNASCCRPSDQCNWEAIGRRGNHGDRGTRDTTARVEQDLMRSSYGRSRLTNSAPCQCDSRNSAVRIVEAIQTFYGRRGSMGDHAAPCDAERLHDQDGMGTRVLHGRRRT